MSEVALVKMSSKGQIVIPSHLRKDFVKGDEFLIYKKKDLLLLKRIKGLDEKTKDDIKFALKTEKAYQQIEKGKCKTLPVEEFLKELEKW